MIDRDRVLQGPSAHLLALLLLTCLCGLPVTALLAQSSPADNSEDVILDRIRAVVNEGVVLQSDIDAATEFFKQQARSNRQTVPPDDVLTNRVLEDLIDQEIRRQHARAVGVTTDASSVNRAIEQIARNNNMDALQFRETLQNQGFDYDLFRQSIDQELLLQRLIEREVQSRIRVTQQEIDDYVDSIRNDAEEQQRYRIQHILLAIPDAATAEQIADAQSRAQEVLTRLRAGDDFAEVAAALSDDARALQGGDLGWRTRQELPGFLSSALADMAPGDVSEPLRSANGLHVIRLADRQSGDQTQQAQTLARHIFIAGDDPAVEGRLRDIRSQLLAGASFAEIAARVSEDPNSAKKGGELPWFSEGQLPPAMEEMADSLAVNELSEPFRTQFGWHLMQVTDRRTQEVDEEALREQASNALRQGKVEQEIERWTRQLRDESFVEIRN